jgi:hypothetical protein
MLKENQASVDVIDCADAPVEDDAVNCKNCSHTITRRRWAYRQDGQQQFEFINPYGHSFSVALFSSAPGIVLDGPPSTIATWFEGYPWTIARCGYCDKHVGWLYQHYGDPTDQFIGISLGAVA